MSFYSRTRTNVYDPLASRQSREALYGLGTSSYTTPTREVAGEDPLTAMTRDLSTNRLYEPSAYNSAIQSATQRLQGASSPLTDIPEWNETLRAGVKENRNLQRSLKLSGNAATQSSRGLREVGKQTTSLQQKLMNMGLSALGTQEQDQLDTARTLGNLQTQRTSSEQNRLLNALSAAEYTRNLEQQANNAQYEAQQGDIAFRYGVQPGILQSALYTPQVSQKTDQGTIGKLTQTVQFARDLYDIYANTIGRIFSWGGSAGGSA